MKCPICNNEMQEGFLTSNSVIRWFPLETCNKKIRLFDKGARLIGELKFLGQGTKVPNAYFCETCNKVIGIFDVKKTIKYLYIASV